MVTRTPPMAVIRTLRSEVGFRCPVSDCGSPYLTWHHFDPSWRIEQHHRPEGIIALCRHHADKADAGTFTPAQLTDMKAHGVKSAAQISGRFDWLRQDVLCIVGSNVYYNVQTPIAINGQPALWFNRNDSEELLVNFFLPNANGRPMIFMKDNTWMIPPPVADLECPPSGRKLHIKSPTGEELRIAFADHDEGGHMVTTLSVVERVHNLPLDVRLQRPNLLEGGSAMNVIHGGTVGIDIQVPPGRGGPMFEDEDVRLVDLVSAEWPVIWGSTFKRCRLYGPAVVTLDDIDAMESSLVMNLTQEEGQWKVPQLSKKVGMIHMRSCRFEQCEFYGVGIAETDRFAGAPGAQDPAGSVGE